MGIQLTWENILNIISQTIVTVFKTNSEALSKYALYAYQSFFKFLILVNVTFKILNKKKIFYNGPLFHSLVIHVSIYILSIQIPDTNCVNICDRKHGFMWIFLSLKT